MRSRKISKIARKTVLVNSQPVACRAKHISAVLPSGVWEGRKCILIGGGPSLVRFDFSILDKELTVGTNKTFVQYSPTVNYAMDPRFYDLVTYLSHRDEAHRWLHSKWINCSAVKVFLRNSLGAVFDPSVYYVNSLVKPKVSFDLDEGIYGGNNAGFGALMLAIALGSKSIGLLGYDFKIDAKCGRTHWHGGYEHQNIDRMQSKLDAFMKPFDESISMIEEQGIEVINLNRDSKLSCFQKSDLKTFLSK